METLAGIPIDSESLPRKECQRGMRLGLDIRGPGRPLQTEQTPKYFSSKACLMAVEIQARSVPFAPALISSEQLGALLHARSLQLPAGQAIKAVESTSASSLCHFCRLESSGNFAPLFPSPVAMRSYDDAVGLGCVGGLKVYPAFHLSFSGVDLGSKHRLPEIMVNQ